MKYSGGDTVFPMRIGNFLCVFGVPKKRHIQRKRFGLRRCETIRVRLKEMREMWFYLKEIQTMPHFTSSQIQKKNHIFWFHYFETQKSLCHVWVGQLNFSDTHCCLGFLQRRAILLGQSWLGIHFEAKDPNRILLF